LSPFFSSRALDSTMRRRSQAFGAPARLLRIDVLYRGWLSSEAKWEAQMESKAAFPAQVLMMVGVALEELQRSEAETDLTRIRNLIMNVESTLIELQGLAAKAGEDTPQRG
jgi:hypothetical protein